MLLHLDPHPDTPCDYIDQLDVELTWKSASRLEVHYTVWGDADQFVYPEETAPGRADGLWRTTCMELFIRPGPGDAYIELNFSPSNQWAAYSFSGYRKGMVNAAGLAVGPFQMVWASHAFELSAELELWPIVGSCRSRSWGVGASAVIEIGGGWKKFWALAHPPGPPDFHDPVAFAATLELPESP